MIPAADLRSNALTLAVPSDRLPAVARLMLRLLPPEKYDPAFQGQRLETTYFDTLGHRLRKARLKGKKYLTLRIRCYQPGGAYALSAKTEDQKFRCALPSDQAEALLRPEVDAQEFGAILPGDLLARLLELTGEEPLVPIVRVCFTRYAVEDTVNRLTLDCDIRADSGKTLTHILEHKTASNPPAPLPELLELALPVVKLSKFLWATSYGVR
jgi:hypothetical protein